MTVSNLSCLPTAADLVITSDEKEGPVLLEQRLEEITNESNLFLLYDLEALIGESGADTLHFSLVAAESELSAGDNHAMLYLALPRELAALAGYPNNDGEIGVADTITVLRSIVGLVELSAGQRQAADVNGSGKVDVADAILILCDIVGLIHQFLVEGD